MRKYMMTSLSICSAIYTSNTLATEGKPEKLDEITVIGEKFERSRSTTSSSLELFSYKEMVRKPNYSALNQLIRNNTNILETGLGNDLPTIRGIEGAGPGAVAFFAGARPRLNTQIDGRTSNYNELAYGTKSLWDIKQVEVYKGPQSYAQGRNAIAGSIIMQSNDPTSEWEGATKITVGNQSRYQVAAMLSGPIIRDEVLFRLSVDRQGRKSFENLATYSPAGNSRQFETTTTRAKLLWLPSNLPDFYSRLTFNHIKSKSPQGENTPNAVSNQYRPVFQTRSGSSIWEIGYQLSPEWKLENRAIYTNYIHDRLSLNFPKGAPARVDGREWQVEPTLKYDYGNHRGLLGIFYFEGNQDDSVSMNVLNAYKDTTKTKAIFGELTFNPTTNLEISIFGRYEQEKHKRVGGLGRFALDHQDKKNVFLPKLDIAYLVDEYQRIGMKVGRGYNPGGAGITFAPPFKTYTYKAEFVWNYELYHRWKSQDKRWLVTSNVFYNDYKDMQIPYTEGRAVYIHNADKVHTYGAELNANWEVADRFHLFGGVGLLKTKLKSYPIASYQGNELARSPRYTLNLGGYYQFPIGVEIGGDIRWTDGYFSNQANSQESRISAYSQANAHIAYNFKYGRVALNIDNIFNSRKKVVTTALGTTYQQPLQLSLSTELRF
ncbi:TonB-dependent receptor [Ursidibacter maritimus]|uniref:TonB-dependent receptor n=2 Tax=Ursidibacter maritimus TaxID=1331689 RepID=A0A949SZE3_9PAST|nr:TonB-dependent receptor [Ursidibacter maritimus]KAE9542094.1 vibriobactin receptor [Ursidibacter maritimus]MBV6523676.1 TonB-dependent receptor [Ursidibacter maritimus]MBV6525218.1 TonB-dependent receptor [Ursidibacter maritimus]MBV6527546.1 TonB-dependent receptor [Ursidibacter maritimus]MBV6530227.1 TonB-dependent receptor [Ursidibacter maritimus]